MAAAADPRRKYALCDGPRVWLAAFNELCRLVVPTTFAKMLWFVREPIHGGSQAALRQIKGFFTPSLGPVPKTLTECTADQPSRVERVTSDPAPFLEIERRPWVDLTR